MVTSLRIALLIGVFTYLFIIFILLKTQKLAVRYAIIWLFSGFILLIFALFPYAMFVLGDIVQVSNPVNFIFLLVIAFMLLCLLSVSSVISGFATKIKRLAQANALLEERIRQLEEQTHSTAPKE
ncbi:MAG: DUF2304 domain-containing protein [Oscillospiraceae bacterium]|nr:DUF2304 domain-containing protein [Oscillospiraceae bacterium]